MRTLRYGDIKARPLPLVTSRGLSIAGFSVVDNSFLKAVPETSGAQRSAVARQSQDIVGNVLANRPLFLPTTAFNHSAPLSQQRRLFISNLRLRITGTFISVFGTPRINVRCFRINQFNNQTVNLALNRDFNFSNLVSSNPNRCTTGVILDLTSLGTFVIEPVFGNQVGAPVERLGLTSEIVNFTGSINGCNTPTQAANVINISYSYKAEFRVP